MTALLRLPPGIGLTRALVRLLRLTIPADLHASGIVVEVAGLEISLRLQQGDTQLRKTEVPVQDTRPNRGRISTPQIHDPGGDSAATSVIPSSRDLAESFLQTEPRQEKAELEAAIASRSMQASVTSANGSDTGTGIPGYSLPSFVANFLRGIGDRLEVSIKDVVLSIESRTLQDQDQPEPTAAEGDKAKVLLTVAELLLPAAGVQGYREEKAPGKRSVMLQQLRMFLLSDQETFSELSPGTTSSSPRLSKGPSSEASTASHTSSPYITRTNTQAASTAPSAARTFTLADQEDVPTHDQQNFMDEFVEDDETDSPDLHSGVRSVALPGGGSSTGSSDSPPAFASDYGSMTASARSGRGIDNRDQAEQLARSVPGAGLKIVLESNRPSSENMAESKLFSHEEAESMYMSAMSHDVAEASRTNAMPGAWDWAGPTSGQTGGSKLARSATENDTREQLKASNDPKNDQENNQDTNSAVAGLPTARSQPLSTASTHAQPSAIPWVAKELLHVDHVVVSLSMHRQDANDPDQEQTEATSIQSDTPVPVSVIGLRGSESKAFSASMLESSIQGSQTNEKREFDNIGANPTELRSSDIEIEVSKINGNFDVPVVKLVNSIMKATLEAFHVETKVDKPDQTNPADGQRSFAITINTFNLRYQENVLEVTEAEALARNSQTRTILESEKEMLLGLRISKVGYTTSPAVSCKQKLSVGRLSLSHDTGELLTFLHHVKMRSSVRDIASATDDCLLAMRYAEDGRQRIEVHTRPVYLKLDLLKIDEVLSRSGGLSSLLDLGNSITSTGTVRVSPKKSGTEKPRPRSVRFEAPARSTTVFLPTEGPADKINIRLGGAFVDLLGSESAVKLQSSSIKLVYREQAARLVIDRAKIEGPLFLDRTGNADIVCRLKNIYLEYLPIPEEQDLDRLLGLLTPSRHKYENDDDDDIMVETLLRQRRKGAVLRVSLDELQTSVNGLACHDRLAKLGTELGKLSTVAKYLPEDDRPGILVLGLLRKLDCVIEVDETIGELRLTASLLEGGNVSIPSLMAAQINNVALYRNGRERLLGTLTTHPSLTGQPPMIMCRFIADEMDPTIKLKLWNICAEYSVHTLMAFSGSSATPNPEKGLPDDPSSQRTMSPAPSTSSSGARSASSLAQRASIAIAVRDSGIGLTPSAMPAKALIVLTDAALASSLENRKENNATVTVKKATILLIDDTSKLSSVTSEPVKSVYFDEDDQVQQLTNAGYIPVSSISSASAIVKIAHLEDGSEQIVDIELHNNLLVLETCADSTQTLISVLGNLAPPAPPSKTAKFRTEVMPIEDLLASFTGDAFVTQPGADIGRRASSKSAAGTDDQEDEQELEYVSEFYEQEESDEHDYGIEDDLEDLGDSYVESELAESAVSTVSPSIAVAPVAVEESVSISSKDQPMARSLLDFRDDYFTTDTAVGGTAHRWNASQGTYGLSNKKKVAASPLRVRVRDVHVIWNLFDGYDWESTRDKIAEAVNAIEVQAIAQRPRSRSRLSPGPEEEEPAVIGDFLFNSIYIGIPANKDPRELTSAINHDIDDMASETGSYATSTTITGSPARREQPLRPRRKKLKLTRSKQHKITFELESISADFLAFPPRSGEVESSLDIRVKNLTIFDHIPTSTWRKFATYMQDAGIRETDTNMVHLEILNVKPIADLTASEIILKVTVLPLRLHVDQDALDFMTRFFEFKDESAPKSATPSAPPFLQRVEVNPIKVKLDFKPKRVDYSGLRSGRTTEFMNFFVLDRADMVLRRVILYGVSGFDRMGTMLNNIWSPDVRRNQLPSVLAGLAPIRSLVDVGGGVKDLVVVPMREYKKDGRIVRSIQKGALAFAKTTTRELISLGAKLAIGTQTVLQEAETMLGPEKGTEQWDDEDTDEESKKQISPYANQPLGVVQGLRGGYAGLERDLLLARDAIVAVPGEVMATTSASGAAKAVLRQAPTIILRPAIGASKAVGQTLLGAGNTLDPHHRRRMEEVSLYFLLAMIPANTNNRNTSVVEVMSGFTSTI